MLAATAYTWLKFAIRYLWQKRKSKTNNSHRKYQRLSRTSNDLPLLISVHQWAGDKFSQVLPFYSSALYPATAVQSRQRFTPFPPYIAQLLSQRWIVVFAFLANLQVRRLLTNTKANTYLAALFVVLFAISAAAQHSQKFAVFSRIQWVQLEEACHCVAFQAFGVASTV